MEKGRCSPRPCGRDRVLVECDGLCHDINDPNECRGGRRLFYTAFGNPICDCPIGEYPFPNRNSDCVALFTQGNFSVRKQTINYRKSTSFLLITNFVLKGPCPPGQVMTLSSLDILVCTPSQCPPVNGPDGKPFQMVPFGNGQCFPLGTRGPCPATPVHLLGYDVFERSVKCVNIEDPSSSYFSSPEEDALIDSLYNQFHPDYDFEIALVHLNLLSRNDTAQRKQSAGIFQLPSSLPKSLLGGCRPGSSGCANPLVYVEMIAKFESCSPNSTLIIKFVMLIGQTHRPEVEKLNRLLSLHNAVVVSDIVRRQGSAEALLDVNLNYL